MHIFFAVHAEREKPRVQKYWQKRSTVSIWKTAIPAESVLPARVLTTVLLPMYWKWTPDDHRFYFLGQGCIGAPALPALIQSNRAKNGEAPLLHGFMAPPISSRYVVNNHGKLEYANLSPESLAEQNQKYNYTFHQIRKSLNKDFELGTLFTTIAGLLNLLVVFDAAGGIVIETDEKKKAKKTADKS